MRQILKKMFRRVLSWDLLTSNEEIIRQGFSGLLTHKLRSVLTMLGIIFGVAAVISMLAIGEGARRKALQQIQALGLQNIIVRQATSPELEDGSLPVLDSEDVQAIRQIVNQAEAVVPVIEKEFTAAYKNRRFDITLTGTQTEYFRLMQLTLHSGGYFSTADEQHYQRVCLLGTDAARALFQVEDPLGKWIKVNNIWLRVIGVLERQPVSTAGSEQVDLNGHVFSPLSTVEVRFPGERAAGLDQIIVRISDRTMVVQNGRLIDQLLLRRSGGRRNYSLIIPEQLLRQSEQTQRIFNIVMGAIAGISLLVGGIGIMNIMLASVLERTREIGVRRSVGATRRTILNQFLAESVMLSLAGGLTGIVVGILLAYGVTLFSDWQTAISLWSVGLSFGVSSAVGILFGWYPARRAAGLNPIEALRHE